MNEQLPSLPSLPSLAALGPRLLGTRTSAPGDGGGWINVKAERKRKAEAARGPPRPPRRERDRPDDAADNQVFKNIRRHTARYERSEREDSDALEATEALRRLIISLHETSWVRNVLFRQKTLIDLVLGAMRRFLAMVHGDQQARARRRAQAMPDGTPAQQSAKRVALSMAEFTDNEITMRIRELLRALPPGSRPADNTYAAQDATVDASKRLERHQQDLDRGADAGPLDLDF